MNTWSEQLTKKEMELIKQQIKEIQKEQINMQKRLDKLESKDVYYK